MSEFKTDVASRSCSHDYLLADFPPTDFPLADLWDEGSAAKLEVLNTRRLPDLVGHPALAWAVGWVHMAKLAEDDVEPVLPAHFPVR